MIAQEQPTSLTLAHLLDLAAAEDPARLLYRFGDENCGCGELRDASLRIAAALSGLGVKRGDAVVLLVTHPIALARIWFAAARLGAFVVPLNVDIPAAAMAGIVQGMDPAVIATQPEFALQAEALRAAAPRAAFLDLLHLPEEDAVDQAGAVHWSDTAMVLGSSGSTGIPKRIVLSHRYVIHIAQEQAKARGIAPGEVLYSPLPVFHINAVTTTLISALLARTAGAFDAKFSARAFWDRCRHYDARHVSLIGSMIPKLHALPVRENDARQPLRTILTSPSQPEIIAAMKARFGVRFIYAFGLTEATPMIGPDAEETLPPGSTGRAGPWFEVELHDEHDEPVPEGAVGEIVCRPRAPGVMFSGYLGNPEATARALRGLWFHTGDLGRRLPGGCYEFTGRAADRLRRGGENISAHEVEAVLLLIPGVSEAAAHNVVGSASEDIRVVIVTAEGASVEARTVAEFAARHLPRFAQPRYLEFAQALPRAASDHLRRSELIAQGVGPQAVDLFELRKGGGAPAP